MPLHVVALMYRCDLEIFLPMSVVCNNVIGLNVNHCPWSDIFKDMMSLFHLCSQVVVGASYGCTPTWYQQKRQVLNINFSGNCFMKLQD